MLSGAHRHQTSSVPQPLLSLLPEAARGADPRTRERPGKGVHVDDRLEGHASRTPTMSDTMSPAEIIQVRPGRRGRTKAWLPLVYVQAELCETEGRDGDARSLAAFGSH